MDKDIRNLIQNATQDARRRIELEYSEQLEGVFDILPDGSIANAPGSHLNAHQRITREKIITVIQHDIAGGQSAKEAVYTYLRESTFTTLNRFAALKMLEARELVQECITRGELSTGFKEFCGLAPGLMQLPDKGYQLYLECVFDELSTDVKILFDRQAPTSYLWPRRQALNDLLDILNRPDISFVWIEDETIGWIYQYFNNDAERKTMKKSSRSPRNTRELAIRNQFFTPRYVVEFLTDNTLGQIWYEMRKGQTLLKEKCRYLVRRPNEVFLQPDEKPPFEESKEEDLSQDELLKKTVFIEHRPKKSPREIKILDPACGSGHFLLYAFDLLERIYEEAWCDPELGPDLWQTLNFKPDTNETAEKNLELLQRKIPKWVIEHNLHGIDIDHRAVQIAALSLWLRAQKSWRKLGLKADERPRIEKTNIVTAEPMPGERDMLQEFTNNPKWRGIGKIVDDVFIKMELAGEAGSLLKIEEEIRDTVAKAKEEWLKTPKHEQQLLFPEYTLIKPKQQGLEFDLSGITDEEFWDRAEQLILDSLKEYARRDKNGRGVRHRLFSDDADHGFAFIDLCRKRYDVVLMNPPFGASSRASKEYLNTRYPNTKGDVLANFIERSLHLLDKNGRIGAISSRTPFFLGSFDSLRSEVLGKIGKVNMMADLGEGVLEAMVETAIYILTHHEEKNEESIFFRLLIEEDKDEELQKLVDDCLSGVISNRIFLKNTKDFVLLTGSPYAYWISRDTIKTISAHPQIEGNKCVVRVGMQTGYDFRFLRCFWEINPISISPTIQTSINNRSVRERCIEDLIRDKIWAPFSKTETASPWFSPIMLVAKWFNNGAELRNFTDDSGKPRSALRSEQEYFKPGFSYMLRSTRLVPYLVPAGVIPTAGRAQIFPNDGQEYTVLGICASNVGSAVARFSGEQFARPKFQASIVQELPACGFSEDTLKNIREYVDTQVNKRREVAKRYEPFQEFTTPAWLHDSCGGETAWDIYSLFGRSLEIEIATAFRLNQEKLTELEWDIREAVSIRATTVEGEDVNDTEDDTNDDDLVLSVELISETPEEKAIGLLMYGVGLTIGRWDIRFAIDHSLAPKLPNPFDPLPVCPPGILVGSDGLPAQPKGIASEEWLRARPDANTLPAEGSVKKLTILDSEYPLQVSWDGILVDDPGLNGAQPHREDIARRIREVMEVLWGERAQDIEREVCEILGISDLREYFRKSSGFFEDHKKRYSKSKRKAPIYWQLSIPSVNYSIWLYYHRFSKDTFYKVLNDYVSPKLKDEERILKEIRQDAGATPTMGQRKEIEQQEIIVEELRAFKAEMEIIAPLWNPNLNDGVIINFAPLWRLVPQHRAWQRECKECWDKLVKGEYDWAHLAMHLWPERVIPKCSVDRSLAIAHGMEDIFWFEDSKGKWKAREVSKENMDELIREKTSTSVKAALDKLLSAPVMAGASSGGGNGAKRRKGKSKSK